LIEGMSLLDALYMTVITLSTVGFAEVQPLSPAGRIFTIALIVVGVTMAGYLVSNLGAVVVAQALGEGLARRRLEKQLHVIRDHYILCGFGRMGQEISREFAGRG